MTRTKLVTAHSEGDQWHVELLDQHQQTLQLQAKCLINATGPWASSFLTQHTNHLHHEIKLVKGSHIVTKKLFDHHYAYIFQHPDHRIIFAIPYLDDYTLIGTTDLVFNGDPDHVAITDDEVSYLCDAMNSYFKKTITPSDVVWSYSGVRPLLEQDNVSNPSSLTRDYHLELMSGDHAPLLSVFGGKITTYRRLAEEGLDLLVPHIAIRGSRWTAKAFLPGGDILGKDFNQFLLEFQQTYAWLPEQLAKRYAHSYGTRALQLLKGVICMKDLGEELSPGLFEQEACYLVNHEWAKEADDILWRRTKLGLAATAESHARLAQWLTHYRRAALVPTMSDKP